MVRWFNNKSYPRNPILPGRVLKLLHGHSQLCQVEFLLPFFLLNLPLLSWPVQQQRTAPPGQGIRFSLGWSFNTKQFRTVESTSTDVCGIVIHLYTVCPHIWHCNRIKTRIVRTVKVMPFTFLVTLPRLVLKICQLQTHTQINRTLIEHFRLYFALILTINLLYIKVY